MKELIDKPHDTSFFNSRDMAFIRDRRFFKTREETKPTMTRHFTDYGVTVIAEPIEAEQIKLMDWRITWENILVITDDDRQFLET